MYFGYLLPTITELMSKFEKLKNSRMNYCQPLLIALHEGVNKRFGELLNDEFLIISATSHPFFKIAWIDNEFKKNTAVILLRDAVMLAHENKSLGVNSPISEHDVDSDCDDNANTSFFSWTQKKPENIAIEAELGDFLKSSPTKKLETLNLTPTLKKVFIKYNTPLPSSAPVGPVLQFVTKWKTPASPRPKKACQVRLNIKTMLVCFFLM